MTTRPKIKPRRVVRSVAIIISTHIVTNMLTLFCRLVVPCALAAGPSLLVAQTPTASADSQAVLTAAVEVGARDLFSPKTTRVLSARMTRSAEWPSIVLQELASRVRARVAHHPDVLSCRSGPSSCELAQGIELMMLGQPVVHGDSAYVEVSVFKPSGFKRSPIALSAREYVIVRQNAKWSVRGVRASSSS